MAQSRELKSNLIKPPIGNKRFFKRQIFKSDEFNEFEPNSFKRSSLSPLAMT